MHTQSKKAPPSLENKQQFVFSFQGWIIAMLDVANDSRFAMAISNKSWCAGTAHTDGKRVGNMVRPSVRSVIGFHTGFVKRIASMALIIVFK